MFTVAVINPNSTEAITDQIRLASADLALPADVQVHTVTAAGGPPAIESDEDVVACVPALRQTASAHPADAYVIACFSDPGIETLRRSTGVPVFGIAESSMLTAMGRGRRVGIVSSVAASVPRHERYFKSVGIDARIVADIPVGRGVLELQGPQAQAEVLDVGRHLVEKMGADVVVLGCAGLSHLRVVLQDLLGVPVIDPCRAAVTLALSSIADGSVTSSLVSSP